MEKFKFSGYIPSWPDWFEDLVEKDKVLVTTDTDPTYENDDNWQEYWVNVAYLWTPDKIVLVYEGDTIVNYGAYCEPEQNDL